MIPALTNELTIHNIVLSLYATFVDTLQKKISFKIKYISFSPKYYTVDKIYNGYTGMC